jgi:hypothetical protein
MGVVPVSFPKTAVASTALLYCPISLWSDLALCSPKKGRRGWERAVRYGQRALVETAMFRYKVLIGPTLRARKLAAQKVEARVACSVINRMTHLGMPRSQRIA